MSECSACEEKSVKITALERIMTRLERGQDAFNWVGHELGLRRKISDLDRKRGLATRTAAKLRVQNGYLRSELGATTRRLAVRDDELDKKKESLRQHKNKLQQLNANPLIRIIDWFSAGIQ